jgi:putative colanic acid biosynthesis acetyltransferase WcaF
MHTHQQINRYLSPWSRAHLFRQLLWEFAWPLLCAWTPKPCNGWRLFILRLFGATLHGTPFVHQRARIDHPWNLILHHRSCLGDRTHAYCLGIVEIGPSACVAQEAYLCTGTHDLQQPHWPLQTASIIIGKDVFIGARAFLLPGVTIGDRAVVGACSVVTRDVKPGSVVVGNPAKQLRP